MNDREFKQDVKFATAIVLIFNYFYHIVSAINELNAMATDRFHSTSTYQMFFLSLLLNDKFLLYLLHIILF